MTAGADRNEVDEQLISVLGQQIRVKIRWGTGVPLVLCNGIGASLEVLDRFVAQLDPDTTVMRFDVPGSGGSPDSLFPYRFPYLAAVLGRLLKKLGILDCAAGMSQVDMLGLSWGGGLAQQFAFQNPHRCRRLILVSTGTGSLMIPAKPSVLGKTLTPRRFIDHRYAAGIAPEIYGGTARSDPMMIKQVFDGQLMAGAGWTSIFMLPLIRQPTLIIAGTDDPIIPVVNARLMSRLLPHATLHLHDGGHVELIARAHEQARLIEAFRRQGSQ